VPTLKGALEKDIDPETGKLKSMITSGKAIFDMLRRQEGAWAVEKKEVARFLNALNAVYKPEEPGLKKLHDEYVAAVQVNSSKDLLVTPDQWLEALGTMPKLDAALKADYDKERVRFNSFRSCGQQLSKLLGNLDRLRFRERQGEEVGDQIKTRKAQVKKMRANGILPSPALSVFNQIDVDKSGTMSADELSRLMKQLKAVYNIAESEAHMMETLDSDADGEVDEVEWCRNLAQLPGLKTALQKDLDPNTGRLRTYRTPRQQFAKLLANIDRMEYDISRFKGDKKDPERVAMHKELTSRRQQAQRFRLAGVTPSAGIIVFAQMDKKKTGQITKEMLTKLFDKMDGFVRDDTAKAVDSIMAKLDADKNGTVSEKEWLEGLDHVQDLKMALQKDIDPETGKLRCMITSGKAIFDMLRRQEGVWAVDKNEVGRYLKCLNAVYKPDNGSMSMEVDDKADELIEAGKVRFIPAACCAR